MNELMNEWIIFNIDCIITFSIETVSKCVCSELLLPGRHIVLDVHLLQRLRLPPLQAQGQQGHSQGERGEEPFPPPLQAQGQHGNSPGNKDERPPPTTTPFFTQKKIVLTFFFIRFCSFFIRLKAIVKNRESWQFKAI